MSLRNLIFYNKFIKKIRQKRCENYIYAFKSDLIFACDTNRRWHRIRMIRPLKLFCFRKISRKKGEKNDK